MRLNNKTYPAIADLESGNWRNVKVIEPFLFDFTSLKEKSERMKALASIGIDLFKQAAHRYYLTHPFTKAIMTAAPKIFDGMKHINNNKTDCGILFGDGQFILYLLNPVDGLIKLTLMAFSRDSIQAFAILSNDEKVGGMYFNAEGKHDQAKLEQWVHMALVTLYFIHHCEIEEKVITPNEKFRKYGVKYFNESKSPFTVLDCTWFTDLVRDTPFSVSGHWRWQPCGVNRSKQRLIFIEPFEKTGYHRTHKKNTDEGVATAQ